MCLKNLSKECSTFSLLVCDGRLFQIPGAEDDKEDLDVSTFLYSCRMQVPDGQMLRIMRAW